MKLHYLRYFAILAEELHFGRAADRLAITQPPLSSAIKALEEELGVRLFLRDSKHVQLTPAGAAFLADVNVILARLARASESALAVASGLRGRLDIGVTGSLFYREVPRIVGAFEKQMPGIEVTLREIATSAQIDGVLHGELQVGFFNVAVAPPQLRYIPLKPDPFVVCVPESHPKADRKSLYVSDLDNESFVMFDRDIAPANYDNVIAVFSRASVHPRTCHAARQWLTIIAMVANGVGVALVPFSLARSGVKGVKFIPLSAAEQAVSPAVLAWNPAYNSAARDSFIACAARVLGVGIPE
jgi:DNA-binding transcriptional LysR family regulator